MFSRFANVFNRAASAFKASSSSSPIQARPLLLIAGGAALASGGAVVFAGNSSERVKHAGVGHHVFVSPSELSELKIFSGNGNQQLANEVAIHLGTQLGRARVGKFADGETSIQVLDNIRGKDVYVIQPTCPPINDNIVELLLMVSTLRRASARKITAVIPYYSYARQDHKSYIRTPIAAADIALMLEEVGVDRLIAVDLHSGQIQGFLSPRVPVDNLDAGIVAVPYFYSKHLNNPVVMSPDANGVYRAQHFRSQLLKHYGVDAGLAMMVQQDSSSPAARQGRSNETKRDFVGEVDGSDVIIIDDMIDTGHRLEVAVQELKQRGAARVFMFATHGLFSENALDRVQNSDVEEVVVTNTIPLPRNHDCTKVRQLSISALIAEAIRRVHTKQSLNQLFQQKPF
eukprot:GILI01012256.1.p1 GENE.GILI01012256.1~~GILI01012256.1.p1  ORF type:complete len:423 (+),score=138.34 GILI01012256.1:68-1270(+)